MNEAEIGLALDERLWSILTNRLPRATATIAASTARRFSGPDALHFGIVEAVMGESDVLAHALEVAEGCQSGPTDTERAQASRARRGGELLGFEL